MIRSLLATAVALGVLATGEPSRVCRITIADLVDGHAVELVAFHRDGRFHHGYAAIPTRDNLVHGLELRPSPPVAFTDAGGKPVDVPERLRNPYAYKQADFAEWKARYDSGALRIVNPTPVPELAWEGGRLHGTVDVLLAPLDSNNTPGRSIHEQAWRIELDLTGASLRGSATAWEYPDNDPDYGATAPRRTLTATARWDEGFWSPRPGTAIVGAWPQAGGPDGTGAAAGSTALVASLHDARLQWVAEDATSGARGSGVTRGGFALFPFSWTGLNYGGFGGPAIADGRVFLIQAQPPAGMLATTGQDAANPYILLGARASGFAASHEVVSAFDAATGRRLWRWVSPRPVDIPDGKVGRGNTPCVVGDRVVVRGGDGLYAFAAASGDLLWHRRSLDKRTALGVAASFRSSSDVSPVLIGGLLVMVVGQGDLIGIDPADGAQRWRVAQAIGANQLPARVLLDGREHVLGVGGIAEKGQPPTATLIDAASGEIRWRKPFFPNNGLVAVAGDLLIANGVASGRDNARVSGWTITAGGLERRWLNDQVHWMDGRHVPVLHRGVYYSDSRSTGLTALDAATGRLLGRHPPIGVQTHGSHNWSWIIASGDRILTSGVIQFSSAAEGFRRLPGRLSLDLDSGYVCPVKPALADGRMVMRLGEKLVCYDLRANPEDHATVALVHGTEGVLGLPAGEAGLDLRLRRGRDGRSTVALRWSKLQGPEAAAINPWVGQTKTELPWRAGPLDTAIWDASGVHGEQRVWAGWQRERWRFDLRAEGDRLQGTVCRIADALPATRTVGGPVGGRTILLGGDRRVHEVRLEQAMANNPSAEAQDLTLILVEVAGRFERAWAFGGKINGNAHEVDARGLTLAGGRLAGSATVLFRDDLFIDLSPANGLLAATYQIEANIAETGLTGTHTGQVGVAFERQIPVSGTVAREDPASILAIAATGGDMPAAEAGDPKE